MYNSNKTDILFIIECKTAGREYQKAYKDTLNDGAQLFSYWQQEASTKWLALYSSDFKDDKIIHKCSVISCIDDANIKELAKKDNTILLYEMADTVNKKYQVWKETYQRQLYDDLIFSDKTVAYNIGIKPKQKLDLEDFNPEDKIVNQFEEILRHNNVSDKENAFNKLIALFICKLVDEISKNDDDIMDFQYKQGTDTYETLQDRLQRLHQKGMKDFMKEEIFYVENDYAEKLFIQYTGQERKKAIEELNKTIRILKFYSNNDFSFKDIHNEELFYQNGKILVEMVKLFQKYRIVYPSKHQFLGDLFEQLLNKGFKQNEGQFFTPIPITRFIWDSLPIQRVIKKDNNSVFPKVIDYACGAGHFLTEGIEAINSYYESINKTEVFNNLWVNEHIYGIEKDYRLARVSKVSMFMNGAGNANIIFGDGLENYPDKGIIPNTFDILVANPPYAVSSFKSHLQLKNNEFNLFDKISNDGSEIEVLFVERISQLVKPKGVVAVILPSSILSNNSSSYIGAREEILKHFYIRTIACFESKTFGETGTNTIVMFLEKMEEKPTRYNLVEDSAEAILLNKINSDWEDEEIYSAYLEKINVDKETYNRFITEREDYKYYESNEYFNNYVQVFNELNWIKNKKQQVTFKNLTIEKKNEWLNQSFYDFVKLKEREKIIYFAMVYKQTVLIITSPSDNNEKKRFLGYDWSHRKGNEGIVINNPGGMLYDDKNRYNENTLAGLIKSSYNGEIRSLDKLNKYYRYASLKDMIDFTTVEFDKSIKTTISKNIEIKSKYPILPLGNVVDIKIGGTPSRANSEYFKGNNLWVSIAEMKGQVITDTKEKITDRAVKESNVKLIPKGTTLLSFKLSIGKTAIAGADLYTNEAIAALIPIDENITNEYLFALFSGEMIDLHNVGNKAFGKSLNSKYLKESVKIPVPPVNIQNKIVEECKKIDEKYNSTRMSIEEYRKEIVETFKELNKLGKRKKLKNISKDIFAGGDIPKNEFSPIITERYFIPIYANGSGEKSLLGYTDKSRVSEDAVTISARGTIGYSKLRKAPFYPAVRLIVLIPNEEKVNKKYLEILLNNTNIKGNGKVIQQLTVPMIKEEEILLPSLDIQSQFVNKVEKINLKIEELENELVDINKRKQDILKKYL